MYSFPVSYFFLLAKLLCRYSWKTTVMGETEEASVDQYIDGNNQMHGVEFLP
jgi:hypothetical protein